MALGRNTMIALANKYDKIKFDAEMKEHELHQLRREKEMGEARKRWEEA